MVTKTGESCWHVHCSSLYTHSTKRLDMPVLQQTHLLWLRVATPNCFDFVICCILQLRSFLFSLSPVIISRMLYSLSPHDLVIDIGFAIAKSMDKKKKYIGSMLEKSRFVAYHAVCWHVHVSLQQQHCNSQRGKELQSLGSCS